MVARESAALHVSMTPMHPLSTPSPIRATYAAHCATPKDDDLDATNTIWVYHRCTPMPTAQPRMALVIPADVKERITELAKSHRRSTSAEIVVAIEAWLDQHKDEN